MTLQLGHYKISRQMTALSDNHRRRILTSLQYVDKQLEVSLNALTPSAQPLFSGSIQDLTPAQARWVESYTVKIRREMAKLLDRLGIEIPPPSNSAMGTIRTSLTSLDVTLEDMYPEKLQGYGKMDAAAAHELSCTLQEIRGLVNWLLAFVSETAGNEMNDLGPAGTTSALMSLCRRLVQIVTDHGLIEFLPALQAIFRRSKSCRCEVAVCGQAGAGKSTFINRLVGLELLPQGGTPLLGLPIRVESGANASLRVTFPDRDETVPLARFAEFASEEQNPGNIRRVVALEVLAPSKCLRAGFAFVEVPDIRKLASREPKLACSYLPGTNFAVALVDARSGVDAEEIDLLRAFHAMHVPCCIILSKWDLLPPHDAERVLAESRKSVEAHLDFLPDVIPGSTAESRLPAFEEWFEKTLTPMLQKSLGEMSDSVDSWARSLCRSIISAEEKRKVSRPAKGSQGETESVLRRLDEKITSFHRRWENEVFEMSGWSDSILDRAAAKMAGGSTSSSCALVQAIASQCGTFLPEYGELCGQLSAGIVELKGLSEPELILSWGLPKPQPLPMPLASFLQSISISPPGTLARINRAVATRHFRKELEATASTALRQTLDELQPRFRHWFLATMSTLSESFRMQTDPVRYWSAAEASVAKNEKYAADMDFLRAHQT